MYWSRQSPPKASRRGAKHGTGALAALAISLASLVSLHADAQPSPASDAGASYETDAGVDVADASVTQDGASTLEARANGGDSAVADAGALLLGPLAPDGGPLSEPDAARQELERSADAGLSVVPVLVPAPAPVAAPPRQSSPTEVTIRRQLSEGQRLQESAEAVNVIEMRRARQQSADLGEVLARTQGVGIRRDGGLGSNSIISLNGLQNDQVRVFLDGVPLQIAGYPFGLVNIPVNLVERVEVYRGVVPLRFGADALGGAINVVTDSSYDTHAGGSYQVGSFGTHRATFNGRYRHVPTGLVLGGAAFIDWAKNDFWMHDREFAADDGSTIVKDVRRFHDAYRAYGGNVEVGVVDQPWAKRLLVQGFASSFDKEMQHNAVMTTPYGEVTTGETIAGATARYDVDLRPDLELQLLANYSHRIVDFDDRSRFNYAWDGTPLMPVGRDEAPVGILPSGPIYKSTYEDMLFGRIGLNWTMAPNHVLRFSATPSTVMRDGKDHVKGRPDLLKVDQRVRQVVFGAQYDLSAFADRLANEAFVKGYIFSAAGEDRRMFTGNVFTRHRRLQRIGGGDSLRFRFTPWLLAKASYEYTLRLPRTDELFGDGRLVEQSANQYRDYLLKPERSHNVNFGPRLELKRTPAGAFMLDVNGFLRESKDMIVLIAGQNFMPYANISDARTLGIESAWSWTSPGRWVSVEGSHTWQDVRNTSTSGPFALQKGLRVPSRPWMFASWGGRVRIPNLPGADDTIEPFYYGRYVHEFLRGWEIGESEFRTGVPSQVSHTVGVTWSMVSRYGKVAATFEVNNVSDGRLYDVFGVERPGRAYYFKLTGQY